MVVPFGGVPAEPLGTPIVGGLGFVFGLVEPPVGRFDPELGDVCAPAMPAVARDNAPVAKRIFKVFVIGRRLLPNGAEDKPARLYADVPVSAPSSSSIEATTRTMPRLPTLMNPVATPRSNIATSGS